MDNSESPLVIMDDLLDLQNRWQSFINTRVQSREGSMERTELDNLYFKVLPVIYEFNESVDDKERYKLVRQVIEMLSTLPNDTRRIEESSDE